MLSRRLALLIVSLAAVLAVAGCTDATPPTWSFAPGATDASGQQPAVQNGTPVAMAGMAGMSGMGQMGGAGGGTTANAAGPVLGTLEIHAVDLAFKPATLSVAQPGAYAIKFVNDGSTTHNITFPDGTSIAAEPKQSATGTVEVPAGGLTFECSIPGHADAGMKGSIAVAGSAASTSGAAGATGGAAAAALPSPDPNAPQYSLFDPVAPAVLPGTVHDVEMPIVEKDITVAPGYVVHAWAFGGQVPGPTIRVHLGDTVHVHLHNQTQMSHSMDFHASQTAMNDQMVEIKPGASWTYTFRADYAGVWMYHCGTAPALEHIANGMFGMVIVEPKGGLPKVDREYAIVQNEWYLGAQGQPADYSKANAANPAPDFVTFNGVAAQYKDHPIQVSAGNNVRIFVLNVGPNEDSSFHVVGTIFHTVIKEGIALVNGNGGGWGSQAVDLAPAQGAIVELTIPENGMYTFVTHAFNFVGRGAVGQFMAGDGTPPAH